MNSNNIVQFICIERHENGQFLLDIGLFKKEIEICIQKKVIEDHTGPIFKCTTLEIGIVTS